MADALLTVENLTKSYGDKLLFEDISFGINAGQKMALIARNGYGKSTLLDILTGKVLQDSGRVTFSGDIKMAYLSQNPEIHSGQTIRDFVFASDNQYIRLIAQYEEALLQTSLGKEAAVNRLTELTNRMDVLNAWDYESRVKEVLGRLSINELDKPVDILSGGERKKVALARTLIDDVNFLILDEPTNHLDIQMIEWLEDFLSKQKLAILMVTHDRYFLDNVCHDIIEIDNSTLYHYRPNNPTIPPYDYYLEKKLERQANAKAEVEKAKSLYRTELEWMRRMPQARGTKARARIDAFYELEQKAHTRFDEKKPELSVKTERIGGKILEMYNVTKAYDGRKMVDDFSYTFKKGEKIGVVGPNGIGKSTFLNLLTEQLRPDTGKVIVGQTIQFGFYTQNGLKAKDDMRVIEIIKEVADVIELEGGKEMTAHQFLTYFGFDGATQFNYFSNLSGGERRRLYLLTVLMANPNFLILDEPTNDLDIYTLEILEKFLKGYKGCLLIVSHDRSFMDNLVDHIFVFEGDGKIKDYHSNYSDYLEEKQRQLKAQQKAQSEVRNEAYQQTQSEKKASSRPKATFKQKQEYEQLGKEIEQLNAEKLQLETLLSSGQETDVEKLTQASNRIGEIIGALDEKEMRWLELDELM
ncbi:MAG: ABC-F family ATP-binding cassette domain-containing protein [Bacteroidales bacterium]|nr:ABC-F family ATP-binding cassette domain-containing protein [Bacteroidales bacterium]